MGIEFVRDERDKQAANPLAVPARPGFQRRWVRTKGYDADGHMSRMQEAGYEPVRRDAQSEKAGRDPRMQTTQGADLDSTIKRGDVMLMECPADRYEARRAAQADLTKRRTQAVKQDMERAGIDVDGRKRRKE